MRNVIYSYDPNTIFKELILLDSKYAKTHIYYLPILRERDCLSDSSILTRDKSSVLHAVIDAEKVGDNAIFSLATLSDLNVAVRLDFVESILRRGVKGVFLEEICVERGSGKS